MISKGKPKASKDGCLSSEEKNGLALFADIVQAINSLSTNRKRHVDSCGLCKHELGILFQTTAGRGAPKRRGGKPIES